MSDASDGLEPNAATMRRWLELVSTFSIDHVDGLEAAPASGPVGAPGMEVARRVSRDIPEQPMPGGLAGLVETIDQAANASLNTAGPGYLAYIPGGGLYTSALADFLACCVNRYTGVAGAAPALVQLEADVLSWLNRQFGYGKDARGLFTSGGSISILSAVVTARENKLGPAADLRRAIVYTSSQAHHAVAKAVALAGIPRQNVRAIDVDAAFGMRTAALERALEQDQSAGNSPFLVIAAAGTTNTGAVDPLPRLADLCQEHDLWLHVDGAYGGAFVLCESGRRVLTGIERADSITFDPHKGMFLPYGTGCLLVQNGEHLRAAHRADADYLQDFEEVDLLPPSPMDYGPELSRDYRGLRVWLPLMLHGAAAFRAALEEKLSLAQFVEQRLCDMSDVEVVTPTQLSVVAFRLKRDPRETVAAWNDRNQRWLGLINSKKRVHMSSTALPVPGETAAAFTLRVCVLSFRTHRVHVDRALEDIATSKDAL